MPILTLLICGLLAGSQAPVRPDLSGEWVLEPAKTTMTGAPMRVGGPGPAGQRLPGTATEPRKTKHVNPVYPPAAVRAKIGGMVLLEAMIDRQGKVRDLRVLRSIPELDQAAMKAVSQWEYTPTLLDGVPIEIVMTVTVTFTLTGQAPVMGAPVPASPWAPPPGAARAGLGRGGAAMEIAFRQNDRELVMTRSAGNAREEIRYRFDGRPSNNRLPGTGGAVDNTYVYVSHWEAEKLVSTISWVGPTGPRERTETLWLDGDTLKMQTVRPSTDPGAEPFVVTNAFSRKR